jgi:hypothetical protein
MSLPGTSCRKGIWYARWQNSDGVHRVRCESEQAAHELYLKNQPRLGPRPGREWSDEHRAAHRAGIERRSAKGSLGAWGLRRALRRSERAKDEATPIDNEPSDPHERGGDAYVPLSERNLYHLTDPVPAKPMPEGMRYDIYKGRRVRIEELSPKMAALPPLPVKVAPPSVRGR